MRALEGLLGRTRHDIRSLAYSAEQLYHPFDIRSSENEKWRHVDNPSVSLKLIQKTIYQRILRKVELPEGFQGGIKGRSTATNAKLHVGRKQLISLDIRNCFHRTSHRKVFDVYCSLFSCSEEIADLLTKLTTYRYGLPVGASTSSMLLALVMLPLYRRLESSLRKRGATLSIYVDDISISGDSVSDLVPWVKRMFHAEKFLIHPSKTKFADSSRCQRTPGAVVNRKVSGGRERFQQVRNEIFDLHKLWVSGVNIDERNQSVRGKVAQFRPLSITQHEALSRCVNSYLPDLTKSPMSRKPQKYWRRCQDWRQDHAADSCLRVR